MAQTDSISPASGQELNVLRAFRPVQQQPWMGVLGEQIWDRFGSYVDLADLAELEVNIIGVTEMLRVSRSVADLGKVSTRSFARQIRRKASPILREPVEATPERFYVHEDVLIDGSAIHSLALRMDCPPSDSNRIDLTHQIDAKVGHHLPWNRKYSPAIKFGTFTQHTLDSEVLAKLMPYVPPIVEIDPAYVRRTPVQQ